MKYLARISYNGSKFQGFQRLNNGLGVQNELERVLSVLNQAPVKVHGSGRTDALVHAIDQCIHFELDKEFELEKLLYVFNRMLSPYVTVNSLNEVDDSFHARFSVKEKTYVYKMYYGSKDVFLEDYALWLNKSVDLSLMKKCAKLFVGGHDFHNFVSGYRDNYESVIKNIKIHKEDKMICIEFKGKSFYRYMVRSLVGAMLDVALGRRTLEEVEYALNHPDEKQEFSVAIPNGLYLTNIKY